MDVLLILAKLVLALIFALAGLAKLRDLPAFKAALAEFGVPVWLRAPVAQVLPPLELMLAPLLLVSATSWWATQLATGLLGVFTAAIAGHLMRGQHPSCNCFGQTQAKPINGLTLLRGLGLLACGLFAAAAGRPAPGPLTLPADLPSGLWLLAALLGLAAAILSWLLLELLRQQGRLLLRIDQLELRLDSIAVDPEAQVASHAAVQGLAVGQIAPQFGGTLLGGAASSLEALLRLRRPLVLVFSDPDCGPCVTLAPRLAGWQRDFGQQALIVLVSRGDRAQNLSKLAMPRLADVFLQADREIAQLYLAFATPSAVRISANGLVDSHLALGDLAIEALIQETGTGPAIEPQQAAAAELGMSQISLA